MCKKLNTIRVLDETPEFPFIFVVQYAMFINRDGLIPVASITPNRGSCVQWILIPYSLLRAWGANRDALACIFPTPTLCVGLFIHLGPVAVSIVHMYWNMCKIGYANSGMFPSPGLLEALLKDHWRPRGRDGLGVGARERVGARGAPGGEGKRGGWEGCLSRATPLLKDSSEQ